MEKGIDEDKKTKKINARLSSIFPSVTDPYSYIEEDFEKEMNFVVGDESYKEKEVTLDDVRKRLAQFKEYMKEKNGLENLNRGYYHLLKDPCNYASAKIGFQLHAYDEREGVKMLDDKREERDGLSRQYENVMRNIYELLVKKLHHERLLEIGIPKITARSSGTPGNKYVFGYGYEYGVGYTDTRLPSTAPGFELTATKHVQDLVRAIGPIKGKQHFEKIYQDIFNAGKINKRKGKTGGNKRDDNRKSIPVLFFN